uniref:BTAF1 RNA polymerase II, BTFIID transcription factorassociated, 170kDa [Alligator mississippiensis] n=1 Tax=Lepeophtheirus salmonis TaxID=72036 RepID=A0A0K2V3X8_LEPSM
METNSRLDRLFILLKSGSSATRESAATQLGRLQSTNPEGLPHLLTRLSSVFKSPDWEARIAAGNALSAIFKSLEAWDPLEWKEENGERNEDCFSLKGGSSFLSVLDEEENISFESLNLDSILQRGTFLRSESKNQESPQSSSLQDQRKHLDDTLGIKSQQLVTNEDLVPEASTPEEDVLAPPPPKRFKWDFESKEQSPNDSPLQPFIQIMFKDLFHESWEIRHGAATALREVLKYHGSSGGKVMNVSACENDRFHRIWLRELSVKIICLIALDRFGDFASDTVVAPVRETGAQALGYAIKVMIEEDVQIVVDILLSLMERREWQCRHGGLLAVKYLLALREANRKKLLAQIFPSVFSGLQDTMDDVVSVAASSLLPVAELLPSTLSSSQLSDLTARLWDSLLDLDDLTASTHSLIKLLSSLLVSLKSDLYVMHSTSSLKDLVPRIYPLLSHSSSLVRQSALEALETLTSRQDLACSFLPHIIRDLSLHLFQRCLLEHYSRNLELIESVWKCTCSNTPIGDLLLATCPLYGPWLILISQPPNWPLQLNNNSNTHFFLGGPDAQLITDLEEKSAYMMRARILAAKLLGFLAGFVVQRVPNMTYTEDPMNQFVGKIILPNLLNTRSAYHRTTVCLVISEWNSLCSFDKSSLPDSLKTSFIRFLTEAVSYDETISAFTALQNEASDLLANLKHYNVNINNMDISGPLTYEHIQNIIEISDESINKNNKIRPKMKTSLIERKHNVMTTLSSVKKDQSILGTMTLAAIAGSAVSLCALPEKLHPLIKPLMESIKKESNVQLQNKSADKLADVMEICTERSPTSNDKIIKNLIAFVSSDSVLTPQLIQEVEDSGIITHFVREKSKLSYSARKKNYGSSKTTQSEEELTTSIVKMKNEIQRRGAIVALQAIVKKFGNLIELKIPKLWDSTIAKSFVPPEEDSSNPSDLVNALQALEVMISSLHIDLYSTLETSVNCLCNYHAKNVSSSLRYMTARVVAEIASISPKVVMTTVIKTILPSLEVSHLAHRRGAIEVIICILDKLGVKIVPYIVLLLVPVLGRMSDTDSQVRLLASNCFATLVRLMPLDSGSDDKELNCDLFSKEILEKKKSERKFIHQLMDAKNAEYFHIPERVMDTELLRSYQRSGVNWLAFLNRYKLHGILCDDMGLGKTLQSICILAGDHYNRINQNMENIPSLVICPPTLRWHWKEEILKFTKGKFLSPLLYNGNTVNRSSTRTFIEKNNILITSYDIVRKDIEFLKEIKWNYIILDEGHIIKNAKAKTTIAIKSLSSNHRLILSGTPIQNSVLEIWSLFDFLMPGYLGSEREFSSKFSKPIIASRESKCSKRDKEAGALATESLHRQILPFVLRRMKEDVLKDLPPKITQDYYCDLSPLQIRLYEEYTLKQKLDDLDGNSIKPTSKSHIFQALQYLRKVCNHPKLVSNELSVTQSQDISVAAKLPALKELLLECGIGIVEGEDNQLCLASQHRALIFFQLKSMIDIVENDLLKNLMPSVTYLRLDGSVPTNMRHEIVQRFNNDVSIDILLLSTSVGGLGLNLTGADTVIFAEHDWNPMKDLQAMDRAHRIGQKKVVNVYRLITRNTIEEKILGLQKFKLKTANTVISSENSSIESMATDQIFDLFSLEENEDQKRRSPESSSRGGGVKSILQSLPELWDEKQYEEEYDINTFISKSKPSSSS